MSVDLAASMALPPPSAKTVSAFTSITNFTAWEISSTGGSGLTSEKTVIFLQAVMYAFTASAVQEDTINASVKSTALSLAMVLRTPKASFPKIISVFNLNRFIAGKILS